MQSKQIIVSEWFYTKFAPKQEEKLKEICALANSISLSSLELNDAQWYLIEPKSLKLHFCSMNTAKQREVTPFTTVPKATLHII